MLDPKVVVHPKNSSLTDFELSTLSRLQDYCRETPSALVLYLHNKGSSRPSSDQTFVRGHRKYMEHFVLSRSRSCLASLRNGASACGVQLTARSSSFDTFQGAARFYAVTSGGRGASTSTACRTWGRSGRGETGDSRRLGSDSPKKRA